jgi:ribonuclease HI
MEIPEKNYAFVDGSYNPATEVYGYGAIIVDQYGIKHTISGRGSGKKLSKMRNVAGELQGAEQVILTAIDLGMKVITIFYDYDGIANWPLEKWRAKNKRTQEYKEFVSRSLKYLNINFQHVKGHSGILENEEVDRLAKEAVGIFKKKGQYRWQLKIG